MILIQVSDDYESKKNLKLKKLNFFAIYFFYGLHEGVPALYEQNVFFFVDHFCLPGSISETFFNPFSVHPWITKYQVTASSSRVLYDTAAILFRIRLGPEHFRKGES